MHTGVVLGLLPDHVTALKPQVTWGMPFSVTCVMFSCSLTVSEAADTFLQLPLPLLHLQQEQR